MRATRAPRRRNRIRSSRYPDLTQIQQAIDRKACRRDGDGFSTFVCKSDLEDILRDHKNTIFDSEEWEEWQIALLKESCCQVICILISIHAFPQVASVRDMFYRHDNRDLNYPRITDEDLWIDRNTRSSYQTGFLNCLPYALQGHFLDAQYKLKPHVLQEQNPNKTLSLDPRVRLPYIEVESDIGIGGYSDVSKVVVPRGYFKTSNNLRNDEPAIFALKRITGPHEFVKEVANNDILKESLTNHKNILHHHISYTQGESFNILLPLAEHGNLEVFLNEGWDAQYTRERYDFADKFPGYVRASNNDLPDLISQFRNVADAVKWLHHEMGLKSDLYLIHMDLKPDNILIRASNTSSVGLWVISDFGISAGKEAIDNAQRSNVQRSNVLLTVGDVYKRISFQQTSRETRTGAKRGEGTYQAPEVELGQKVGRKSDVWSLACIFAEVLAFSLGGRDLLRKCRDGRKLKRRYGEDDYFYAENSTPNLQTEIGPSSFGIRPAVVEWLTELKWQSSIIWVKHSAEVILDTLVIDMKDRPDATKFTLRVNNLGESGSTQGSGRRSSNVPTASANVTLIDGLSSRRGSSLHAMSQVSTEVRGLPLPPRPPSESLDLVRLMSSAKDFTASTRSINLGRKPTKALTGSICSSGRHAVWIIRENSLKSHLRVVTTTENRDLSVTDQVISLQEEAEWKQVAIAAPFIGVLGHMRKEPNRKTVCFYDLQHTHNPLEMPLDIDNVRSLKVAVSSDGFGALMSRECLVLFDMDSSRVGQRLQRTLPAARRHTFRNVSFSRSNGVLQAWSSGQNGEEAVYCWRIRHPDLVIGLDLYRFGENSAPTSNPSITMLDIPQAINLDQPVDQVIIQRDRSILDVRSASEGQMTLQSSFSLGSSILADVYKDKCLVRVTPYRGKYRVRIHLEPFKYGEKAQGKQIHEFSAGNSSALCDLRVAKSEGSMIFVILLLDGDIITIKPDSTGAFTTSPRH